MNVFINQVMLASVLPPRPVRSYYVSLYIIAYIQWTSYSYQLAIWLSLSGDLVFTFWCKSVCFLFAQETYGFIEAIQNNWLVHDDVMKWRHFPHWPFVRGIHRSPVNFLHKGQWGGALMFSLICAWTNGRLNNRYSGDLRRHQSHYDVTVMYQMVCMWVIYLRLHNRISSSSFLKKLLYALFTANSWLHSRPVNCHRFKIMFIKKPQCFQNCYFNFPVFTSLVN